MLQFMIFRSTSANEAIDVGFHLHHLCTLYQEGLKIEQL